MRCMYTKKFFIAYLKFKFNKVGVYDTYFE